MISSGNAFTVARGDGFSLIQRQMTVNDRHLRGIALILVVKAHYDATYPLTTTESKYVHDFAAGRALVVLSPTKEGTAERCAVL